MTPPAGVAQVPDRERRTGGASPVPTDPLAGLPLLEDLPPLDGRRVLVRVDFNVPLDVDATGTTVVADDFRIRTALPTLTWLQDQGAKVTACSHLGRPTDGPDPRWVMDPVRARLAELCPGVALTENLRFNRGEKANDPAFVRALVDGHDAYVDEAFAVAHRSHASVVGPPRHLQSAAGRRLEREVAVLGGLISGAVAPFVAVVGGAKVGEKIGVLRALATKVDTLIVGGAMAFSFLAALGHRVGASLVDPERLEDCRQLLDSGVRLLLPEDVVALAPGAVFADGSGRQGTGETAVMGRDLPQGWTGLDIGPASAARFAAALAGAGTVLWNGPMGAFEDQRFAAGTRALAAAVADCPGFSVVGGGDSASALDHLGMTEGVDFISTGGGASLRFIETGDLPGLAALRGAANAPRPPAGA